MPLGALLVEKQLVTEDKIEAALERQKLVGGLLGDNLVALGYISREELEAFLQEPPQIPRTIKETGLSTQFLINSVLKAIYLTNVETVPELSEIIKLTPSIIDAVLQTAKKDGLVEVRGAVGSNSNLLRHGLTTLGRQWALDALRQSQYNGPAPVPLGDYISQVQKQATVNERINGAALKRNLSHLVVADHIPRRLGPAINSGKSILIYGASGNGKTVISEAIGATFERSIYIPHCIEVDGQVIKIYDAALHRALSAPQKPAATSVTGVQYRHEEFDPRWVRCRRPVVITGGELTLEMLDLDFDPISKYYEAPLQVKAVGGVFVIDDFGRQLVRPRDLLNRWIIPLEKKVDYLTLHTGKKFEVPFDELVIFSTNLDPAELSDPAFLRRIQYKIRIDPPTPEDYKKIFERVCNAYRLELPHEVLSWMMDTFYPETGTPIAAFHPRFIVEHAIAACAFDSVPPRLTLDLVKDAVENLVIRDRPGGRDRQVARKRVAAGGLAPARSPSPDDDEDVEGIAETR
ncbi:MAG TPA: hypothetical protein VNL14_12530 [Candidatus Acidoferrales bacterium]|nr:hypothetical protein [Candidatus Acidoferrales bacterium]